LCRLRAIRVPWKEGARRKGVILIVTAVLALATIPSPALAIDLCIEFEGTVIVAKNFTLPSKNKCKPFNGFFLGALVVGDGPYEGRQLALPRALHGSSRGR